jgi:Domain of unknown function (DUF4331)
MSSHREAPEISKDPVADNTDTYAFVSPDNPGTVTLITNYLPTEVPAGGPNFFEFGNDILYAIHVDNDGDGVADITYEFRFEATITNPNTFLYNTGPIGSLTDSNWNRRQSYSVTRVDHSNGRRGGEDKVTLLGEGLACPPCNIGPRSTPNYSNLAQEAVYGLSGGQTVFAGQRNDPFFVDIGSIFDLGDLRPIENLQLIPTAAAPGVDTLSILNVHSIAIQVPIRSLTADGSMPTNVLSSTAVIGVWGSASRRALRVTDGAYSERSEVGPWVQVSRLGCPLFNEVIVPMSRKDEWNARQPVGDEAFVSYVRKPELAGLLPVLYPKAFPNLEALKGPREDLVAVFLTGLPAGVVPGFQNNTGKVLAEMLRLNVAVPAAAEPNVLGILGGDLAGYPNGRRVTDDVTNVSLRAVAGATYPLVEKNYTPDAAVSAITQGITPSPSRTQSTFPYVGEPHSGFDFPSATE